MYLCKRICILSKTMCRDLWKTACSQINFTFFSCSVSDVAYLFFTLLENFKLVLLTKDLLIKYCLKRRSRYFTCKQN